MEQKRDFKVNISIIAILLLFTASFAGSSENPGMQVIIEYWTARGVSVQAVRMMSTIQSLVSLPFTLTVGTFVGKRISYRATAITAVSCIVVGSLAPFFINSSWGIVLFFRGLMGVGVGLVGCRTSLLLSSVPTDRRTQFMGIAQACSLSLGLISGPIVGMLSGISWRHIFLINIYTVVVLVFMFFIKEPPKAEESAGTAKPSGGKFSPVMLKYAFIQPFAAAFSFPIIVGISTYLAGHNIGNATLAGTVLIFYSLGCVAVSSLGTVQKFFKRFTMSFCYLLVASAFLLLVVFPHVVTAFIAVFMVGFGYMGGFSLMQVYAGSAVSPDQMPLATSILLTGNQLGMFASTWMMTLAHSIFHMTTDVDSTFVLGIIVYCVLAVLASIRGVIIPKEQA